MTPPDGTYQPQPGVHISLSPAMVTVAVLLFTALVGIIGFVLDTRSEVRSNRDVLTVQGGRLDRLEAGIVAQVNKIDRNVDYLCNERRRDNVEAGRSTPIDCR